MAEIFLGKPWHWALLVATGALFWLCGTARYHVIEFNLFVIGVVVGTAAVVFAVVYLHRPGDRITRDTLVADSTNEDAAPASAQN